MSVPPFLGYASTGVSVFSYFTTGKGSGDHVLSAINQEDCALHRLITEGEVCRPLKETVAKIEKKDSITYDLVVDLSLSNYQQQANLLLEY